jgi:DNA transposition AAA+ family ATPase
MMDETFDNVRDVFDRLWQDARVQPLEDDLMDVKTTEGLSASRDFVNRTITDGMVSAADLARRTNIKASAISAFRNDKWKGSAGTQCTVASTLCKAINGIIRQKQADATKIDGFVRTRVAEQIFALTEYARKRRMIAAFVIPAGHGKSTALQAVAEDVPGAVLLTVTRARASAKSFLQLFARALGLDEQGRAEDIQDRIVNRLVGSDRLVLIDEAHKLQVPALDSLREIWDEAKVPVVMAGTPSFKNTLTSQRVGTVARELLDQLYSRVGMFRDLSDLVSQSEDDPGQLVNREDIRKVFARGRVRISTDGIDLLCKIANSPASGGLRVCRDLVQIVADLYPGETITAALLRIALGTRVGTREAGFIIGLAQAEPAEQESQAAAG